MRTVPRLQPSGQIVQHVFTALYATRTHDSIRGWLRLGSTAAHRALIVRACSGAREANAPRLPAQPAAWLGMANGSKSSVPQPAHKRSVAGVTPSHCWQKMTRCRGVVISQSAAKWLYCQRWR